MIGKANVEPVAFVVDVSLKDCTGPCSSWHVVSAATGLHHDGWMERERVVLSRVGPLNYGQNQMFVVVLCVAC